MLIRSGLFAALAICAIMAPENDGGGGGGGQDTPPAPSKAKGKQASADKVPEDKRQVGADSVWIEHAKHGHARTEREHLAVWQKKGWEVCGDEEAAELNRKRNQAVADTNAIPATQAENADKAAELVALIRTDPAIANAVAVALGLK